MPSAPSSTRVSAPATWEVRRRRAGSPPPSSPSCPDEPIPTGNEEATMTPPPATTDLCDEHPDAQGCEPLFQAYGGVPAFCGPIATLKGFEDNTMVREAVAQPGEGRVLVVDGGGSLRCSLLGGNLAVAAAQNGWRGVVINGCVREVDELAAQLIGVGAPAASPPQS